MKIWELKEGVEYVSGDCLYVVMDNVLTMKYIKECRYSASQMNYNDVVNMDFTLYTPPTDWSKVEVDTKVLVRGNYTKVWTRVHFAKFEDGYIYTWRDGKTSFTSSNKDVTAWDEDDAKLYTE